MRYINCEEAGTCLRVFSPSAEIFTHQNETLKILVHRGLHTINVGGFTSQTLLKIF